MLTLYTTVYYCGTQFAPVQVVVNCTEQAFYSRELREGVLKTNSYHPLEDGTHPAAFPTLAYS